jgi:hypothetical protein
VAFSWDSVKATEPATSYFINLRLFVFKNTKKSAEIACISADFMIFNRFFVVPPGIEPGTQGFSVLCSTN